MGQFKIGNLSLSSAYLGENSVNKIYLGTVLLYQREEPITEEFITDTKGTIIFRRGGTKSVVPLVYNEENISTISNTAYNYSDVEEVIIPEGITEIM